MDMIQLADAIALKVGSEDFGICLKTADTNYFFIISYCFL